jgi:hypothetical protein
MAQGSSPGWESKIWVGRVREIEKVWRWNCTKLSGVLGEREVQERCKWRRHEHNETRSAISTYDNVMK